MRPKPFIFRLILFGFCLVALLSPVTAAAPASEPLTSVLVVPFRPIGQADKYTWVSDAIDESLRNAAAHNVDVRMLAKPAENAGGDAEAAALDAARHAGATYVVTGTYQIIEDRLRVSGRVTDVARGTQVGSLQSTGLVRDLFAMEDELTDQLNRLLPGYSATAPTRYTPWTYYPDDEIGRYGYETPGYYSTPNYGQEYPEPSAIYGEPPIASVFVPELPIFGAFSAFDFDFLFFPRDHFFFHDRFFHDRFDRDRFRFRNDFRGDRFGSRFGFNNNRFEDRFGSRFGREPFGARRNFGFNNTRSFNRFGGRAPSFQRSPFMGRSSFPMSRGFRGGFGRSMGGMRGMGGFSHGGHR